MVRLCGDFNVSVLSNGEDSRQLELLSQSGFEDLYRLRHMNKKSLTYEFDLHKPPVSRLSRGVRHTQRRLGSQVCMG